MAFPFGRQQTALYDVSLLPQRSIAVFPPSLLSFFPPLLSPFLFSFRHLNETEAERVCEVRRNAFYGMES